MTWLFLCFMAFPMPRSGVDVPKRPSTFTWAKNPLSHWRHV